MDASDYQERTSLTAIYPAIGGHRFVYPAIGLAGEAGEFCNKVKKIFRDDNGFISDERRGELRKELGGVAWYLAQCAESLGLDLSDIMRNNLNELASRAERGVIKGSGDNR